MLPVEVRVVIGHLYMYSIAPSAKLRLEEITLSPTRRLLENFSGNILLFGDFSTIGYRKKEP